MDTKTLANRFYYDGLNLRWLKIKEKSWRDKVWNSRHANEIAGTISRKKSGTCYRRVWINGDKQYAHRIVWLLLNGDIPEGMEVDHIDGNGLNNTVENLRLVTAAENRKNNPISAKNKSGCTGVSWDKRRGKWCAIIGVSGRIRHLGYFDDFTHAVMIRKEAEKTFGFHENHGREKQ